ncbi:archaetidylserine decarboxylase [Sansalvadorimonas sp. 2012CJ34-2]|uniref:Phosphatidylserine decarboxylase proenzyme n=1 Tax=Parendozoicomonas callyspongiae TaxID=2942213 RepID=A0ABT0PFM4_9GAMM|nr:archaetidylserine decarboxylase [Sansalvadorimonas sp. 2012CJ34-2]MCL6270165.1 archaetidylserine decarboxylase [Sansalvadorimonas sp. 2012CJ34-2]
MNRVTGSYSPGGAIPLPSTPSAEQKKNQSVTTQTSLKSTQSTETPRTVLADTTVTETKPTASVKKTSWITKIPGINWLRQRLSHGSDKLFVLAQKALPHHTFSRLFGLFANCRIPFLKNLFINSFIWIHNINMEETKRHSASEFDCFNDFFTRNLKEGVRPITEEGQIASPVDGTIGQIGPIQGEQLIQAKDHTYTLTELLGGDEEAAKQFENGQFTTMYLSPSDYHHFHMPVNGKLLWTTHIPGKLFSVNPKTVRSKPKLFAHNERLVAMFDTDHGPMAMIMVGAINVSSIETTWGGLENPHGKHNGRYDLVHKDYQADNHRFSKGDNAGDFKLGSTVICLFGKECNGWLKSLQAGTKVKMGQPISPPSNQ